MTPPLPTPALVSSYEAALYEVMGDDPVALRIGTPASPDWLNKCGARSATLITAWNPFSQELEEAINKSRLRQLVATVCAEGLRYLPAQGRDPSGLWASEPGLCVLDASRELALQWLREFDQFAAVVASPTACSLLWHPDVTPPSLAAP